MKHRMTPAQRRQLFVLFREAGMDDVARKDYAENVCGKRSTREMSKRDAIKVIRDLKVRLGHESPETLKNNNQHGDTEGTEKKRKLKATDPATTEQLVFINGLFTKIEASKGRTRGALLRRCTGKAFVETVDDGRKAIEMLKGMAERGFKCTKDSSQ